VKIAGIDYSPVSPAVVVFNLDPDNLEIKSINWHGVTDVMKNQKLYPQNLETVRLKDYPYYIDRNIAVRERITAFLSYHHPEYAAIEDYAFAGKGKVFHIGEATGPIKEFIYTRRMKLRYYDITYIKKFATGSAASHVDKVVIARAFEALEEMKPDISKLDILRGKSPSADIIDAFFICRILHTELMLRKGLIKLQDLPEHVIWVFNRTTNSEPENLLCRPFVQSPQAV